MNKILKIQRKQTYSESNRSFLKKFYVDLTFKARQDFFKILRENTQYNIRKSIIDIGTTPSLDNEQNIFLKNTSNNKNLSILSNQNCQILKKKFKNIKKIYIGDGKKNNLKSNLFDIVHSNATLEHVGSFLNQISFVKECLRISKKYVFIQTPNKFYPMELHTLIPFIHWLPKKIHRKILNLLGLNFYALEKNLNLLSEGDLIKICKKLEINEYKIIKYKLFFFTSNLMLIIKK